MWKRLTVQDLKIILSEDEVNTLQNTSTSFEDTAQEVLDLASDMFRGSLRAKGYAYDIREHYTPSSYHLKILQHVREIIWTRFPHSNIIAIDHLRESEADSLDEILKDPYLSPETPEDEYNSEKQNSTVYSGQLFVPYLRFDENYINMSSVLTGIC